MADEDTEISRSQQQNQDFVVVPKATLTQKSIGLVVDHCHNCDAPSSSLEQQNGKVICTACGSFAGPGAIISDVQFSENAAGAATLQGARVGQDQSRAKTFSGSRNRAIDGLSSKEQSQERGKLSSLVETSVQ